MAKGAPRVDEVEGRRALEYHNDTYGADLARLGVMTVCPDNRSFGWAACPEPYNYNSYDWHLAEIVWQNALGRSFVGACAWDAIRVLEHVITSRRDVDPERIGCIGFSLGGLLTTYVALLESRIRVSVIAGFFDAYHDRIMDGFGADCLCNYIHRMFEWFDIPDLIAAIAPRPVLCVRELYAKCGGRSVDEARKLMRKHFARVDRSYEAFKAKGSAELRLFESTGHVFNGELAYPYLIKHLVS